MHLGIQSALADAEGSAGAMTRDLATLTVGGAQQLLARTWLARTVAFE